VAAWQWHDKAGWRVQAAVRAPGETRFDTPQTLSPPAPTTRRYAHRPWIHVAAGDGGRAALTWQIGGDSSLPEGPLHVVTAGPSGTFGADQSFPDARGLADVALAIDPSGIVQLAYVDEDYDPDLSSSLHVAQGGVGVPLSPPAVLATGGRSLESGSRVAAAVAADGTVTVAWTKIRGDNYDEGGTLEVYTRAAQGAFGAAQQVATNAESVVLDAGPGASAVLAWMSGTRAGLRVHWTVHAATRLRAGGGFGAAAAISDPARNALWPSTAITPAGDAITTWVTNTDGSGGGRVAAAVEHIGG
jgi:hypothetical protein